MPLKRLLGLAAAAAVFVICADAAAQDLIVSRNVNLRPDPSTAQPSLRLMMPGAELFLLEPDRTNGYFHVRTLDGLVGWAYAPRISVIEPDPTAPSQPPTSGPEEVFNGCQPEGTANFASDQARNVLKNRNTAPTPADIDGTITLTAILAPTNNDENRFQNTAGVTITGFVRDVIPGGVETVNCAASADAMRDTHIEITLSGTDTADSRRFVVEVTPKWRASVAGQGQDWSTTALRDAFEGRCVQVTGWMFFDLRHRHNAANTNPTGTQIHRATAWEIHPVTAISQVPC